MPGLTLSISHLKISRPTALKKTIQIDFTESVKKTIRIVAAMI